MVFLTGLSLETEEGSGKMKSDIFTSLSMVHVWAKLAWRLNVSKIRLWDGWDGIHPGSSSALGWGHNRCSSLSCAGELGLRINENAGMVGSDIWTLKAGMEQKPEEKKGIMTTNKVTSCHFQEMDTSESCLAR